MNNLLLYCRPGFEKEAAAEITERAGNMQCYGFARVKDDSGYVIFELYDEEQADLLARKLPFRELIFIRQMLVVTHELKDLEISDRVSPILEAASGYAICGDLRLPWQNSLLCFNYTANKKPCQKIITAQRYRRLSRHNRGGDDGSGRTQETQDGAGIRFQRDDDGAFEVIRLIRFGLFAGQVVRVDALTFVIHTGEGFRGVFARVVLFALAHQHINNHGGSFLSGLA
jgi:hypothetical protein